jgi:sugar lactone lactonase YvrE
LKNRLPIIAAGLLALAAATSAIAAETVVHTDTAERLFRGSLDGIAVSSDGRLTLAPVVRGLAPEGTFPGAARTWSMAATPEGSLYAGTGPAGKIYRIRPGLAPELLAELDEPMVTALAVLEDGTVLAGGSPGGRIYRIDPDGSADLWAELEERYIWDLAVSESGQVFAATGDNGKLFEIDRRGTAEQLFVAQEPHLVRLLLHPQGGLLAGGGGRGMLYRIDAEGHGLVLYDDDLDQVTGITLEPDGSILAALMAAATIAPGPAAVRFNLPGDVASGSPGSRVELLEEQADTIIKGRIEGLQPGTERRPARTTGRVVRILPSGGPRELWKSTTETPFTMAVDSAGRSVFGTGTPARLYRCDREGVTLLLDLPQSMASAMVPLRDSLAVATSNPATPYVLAWNHREPGVYLSPVRDAGTVARWGAVRWGGSGLPGEVELYTRTGNGPIPDRTWSAWSPARTISGSGGSGSPDGRYLQWRLRIPGGAAGASASQVTVACHPDNRPPVLESFRIDPDGSPAPGRTRFIWAASDPDGDEPQVMVEYRGNRNEDWIPAAINGASGGGTWATGSLAEGLYQVRARVGDHPANSWRDGLWGSPVRTLTVAVDRTPPLIEIAPGPDGLVLTATDDLSPVIRVEILMEGRLLHLGHPMDGVADSSVESFLVPAAGDGQGPVRTVRVLDAAGNVAEQPL